MNQEIEATAKADSKQRKRTKRNWIVIMLLALLYIISPIDLLPEGLIGPGGYADDAMLLAYLLKKAYDFWRKR